MCCNQSELRQNTKMTTWVYIYSLTEAAGMGWGGVFEPAEGVKWYANPAFHLPRLSYENERGNGIVYSDTTWALWNKKRNKAQSLRESGPSCLSAWKSLSLTDDKKRETQRQEVELKEVGLTGKWGSVIWPLILTLRCISRWSCFFVPSLYGGIPSLQ